MNRSTWNSRRLARVVAMGTLGLWACSKFAVPPLIRAINDGSISTPWDDHIARILGGHSVDRFILYQDRLALVLVASVLLLGCALYFFRRFRDDSWPHRALRTLEDHTAVIDALPDSQIGWWIALATGVGIFAELLVIRLHGSYFEVFAYFKNLSLLACFLGLGIGYARGTRGLLSTPLVLPLLAFQVVIMALLRWAGGGAVLENPVSEQVGFGVGQTVTLLQSAVVLFFFLAVFSFNAICFLPLGQLASRLMSRRSHLSAYSWNLFGSLLAIALFGLLSMWWSPPPIWIACVSAMTIPFMRKRGMLGVSLSATTIAILVTTLLPSASLVEIYSPYQVLNLKQEPGLAPGSGDYYNLQVNNTYYQRMLGLTDENIADSPALKQAARLYDFPYAVETRPANVLVVGAGTGNDVAAAVRNGAGHVDAVEIDPAILKIGESLHPERPYSSESVDAVVNDARAFIRNTAHKYDLIVYGLLDSHTLLSGRGGVRLDSFVYTVEGFREAASRLQEDGLLCLSFALIKPELGRKLFLMLREATGRAPLVFDTGTGTTFLSGPRVSRINASSLEEMTGAEWLRDSYDDDAGIHADVSTDDWPFFYMPVRQYPLSYVVIVAMLTALSLFFVKRLATGVAAGFSAPCFFLGAGFMLVETKGITELALVYGTTWVVASVMIAGVLVMAFLANLVVIRSRAPRALITYGMLVGSLVLGLALTTSLPKTMPELGVKLVVTVLLTLPIFFSGFAFSTELKKTPSVGVALSSNLLGGMLGGFLEYNTMYFGIHSLYWIAIVTYVAAFIVSTRQPMSLALRK